MAIPRRGGIPFSPQQSWLNPAIAAALSQQLNPLSQQLPIRSLVSPQALEQQPQVGGFPFGFGQAIDPYTNAMQTHLASQLANPLQQLSGINPWQAYKVMAATGAVPNLTPHGTAGVPYGQTFPSIGI